jgi:putative ABC transport system permease protein
MANLLRDARHGVRTLLKNPGFASVALFTLALGVAANTAIFSVVYATLLAPLPFPEPQQLVMVWSRIQNNRNGVSAGDFTDWKHQATVFQDLNAWTGRSFNLATADRPEKIDGRAVTPGWLTMVGYDFALGRSFREEEGTAGHERVLVLTHRLWQQRFNADPAIIGRDLRVDGQPYTVVGVLAAGPADRMQDLLYAPLVFSPEQLNHDFHWLLVMGRLKPGVTVEQGTANMVAVARHIADEHPASNTGWSASVEPLQNNFLNQDTITALWLLLGAVAFVLLIACANVANLLLARGTARQRELAIRSALGASRGEIVRQFMTESLVLAVAGGVLGVVLAAGLLHVIMSLMPPYTLPSEADVRLNLPVLLFTLAATAVSGLLFGAAPAWQGARTNVNATLKESGRAVAASRQRLQRSLIVIEFALALTLLAAGGLAIHSLFNLSRVNLGFRADHLLTFSLPVPQGRLPTADRVNAFYDQLLERVQASPGITAASISTGMPVQGTNFGMPFYIAGKPVADPGRRPGAGFNMVSVDYHRTFGIPLVRGRTFTSADRAGSPPVAIVNQRFVTEFLKDVNPLTQRIVIEQLIPGETRLGPAIEWQIVGVYGEVRNAGPGNDGFPEIDVPFAQSPWPGASMAVRTAGDPASVARTVAAAIQSLDPDLPMADVKTMDQLVSESMANSRFNTALFGAFAAVALLLAAFGVYGVMSFAVAQRTHEIGLRMALGSGRGRVLRQILREGMTTAIAGTVLGTIGAYYVGRAMQGMVFGVGAMDPIAFGLVALTLLATALVACLVPAGRAASVDPIVALRED